MDFQVGVLNCLAISVSHICLFCFDLGELLANYRFWPTSKRITLAGNLFRICRLVLQHFQMS